MSIKAVLALILLTGCGYQVGVAPPVTFQIGSIPGDHDRSFQSELIAAIAASSGFQYMPFGADIEINMTVDRLKTEHHDYRYQTEDGSGAVIDRLSPIGAKHQAVVTCQVLRRSSGQPLLTAQPFRQELNFDFVDFRSYQDLAFNEFSGQQATTLQYSLGQLGAEDDAAKSALRPLFKKVAEKVASYLLINREKL